jgi:cytochrome c
LSQLKRPIEDQVYFEPFNSLQESQLKSIVYLAGVLATLGWCGQAIASTQLAQEKQCMQCHAVDKHVIGPSFQTIGATYRRMSHPEAKLMAVISQGSAAHLGPLWDKARMPDDSERPKVSKREARQLARWILSKENAP